MLDVEGTWRELTGVVNKLAANLTNQVRNIARVTKAVALGDLSKQIDVDARGEILDLKNTVNGMVVRLRALAAEVTRVTLEVGSQGILGGQAHVPDVEGVWLELTRNVSQFPSWMSFFNAWRFAQVNRMCSSLTDQVRSIATVTTAVARGDLTRKIEIQVEGEMATLKTTVNSMVDQLSAFASEVTRVALEVGTQGILGGQARVEGVQGTWADLTLNVNVSTSLRTSRFDISFSAENGKQSDRSGALDLGGDQGCRARRFVQAGRSGRARRNARPQDDGQLNGEPAVYPRERGHACITGSRNRGHFGRTSLRSGRAGHVEGASFISPDSGVTIRMSVLT